MYKTTAGKTINLKTAKEIASGGEGKILEHPANKNLVVKLYHTPRKPEYALHLEALSNLNKDVFVSPIDIFYDDKGNTAGFSMNYVNLNDYWLFNKLFNKGFCTSNGITKDDKFTILSLIKTNLEELHKNDIVIGDLNMYNIFFSKRKGKIDILFVDVDSYQTKDQAHSGVLLDEIRDWTTLAINKSTDAFAFDVLAFWSTTFCHPYKWVLPGNKETLEQRVKQGKSFLSSIQGIKIPALYDAPVGEIEKQFKEVFNNGRRYMVSLTNVPIISAPNVVKQPVVSTSLEIRELYPGQTFTHIYNNTFSISARKTNGAWMYIETVIPKVTRLITDSLGRYDIMFPVRSSYITVKGNILTIGDKEYFFGQPEFYYNNESLVVFDYSTDMQWNFDLSDLRYGVAHTTTPVFTKSIVIRDTPIQNFGAQKYLNIPLKNKYKLEQVNHGVKNAIYCNGFIGLEFKTKSKVLYTIFDTGYSLKPTIDLDYLPYFTVKGDLVFVPENGWIDVYKDGTNIAKLDCNICTRDSKLYTTGSGILLLENNILYLLNTK